MYNINALKLNDDIEQKLSCLSIIWRQMVNGDNSLYELVEVYKKIAKNLPRSRYYCTDNMLVDRERYSVLRGPNYIDSILESNGVDSISQLSENAKEEVWEILESSYGSFTIDW